MDKKIVSKRVVKKDTLKLEGIYSQGYGIIAKMVMRDKRLSIEAKAIYSYLCSFCGKGETAFPSVELQLSELGVSENRYRKHRKQLIDLGYIRVEQQREKVEYSDGTSQERRTNNIYTIVTSLPTEQGEKETKNCKKIVSKNRKVLSIHFEGVDNVCIENECTINNNLTNNNLTNNSSSNEKPSDEDDNNKVDTVKVDKIKRILQHCQKCNFKLQRRTVEKIVDSYKVDTIIQAITTAVTVGDDIKKPASYLLAILNDMSKDKTVTINKVTNNSTNTAANKFNNFQQRKYSKEDISAMEKILLSKQG